MNDERQYYTTFSQYHAYALSYLGFKYYKFTWEGKLQYKFEMTDEFKDALTQLKAIKDKTRK